MNLDINVHVAGVLTVLLVGVRIAAAIMLTPPFYFSALPTPVRVMLVLLLAVLITSARGAQALESVAPAALLGAAVRECLIGLCMGIGIHVAFAAFTLGGRLLDIQIGFGMGQVFDPVTRQQIPVLTALFNLIAVVLFYSANMHHLVLRGLYESIDRIPVGGTEVVGLFVGPQFTQLGSMFALGFALVAPVVICLLMVEAAVGLIARSLQKANLFIFSIPIRIGVGLGALALWMHGAAPATKRIYDSVFAVWEGAFR